MKRGLLIFSIIAILTAMAMIYISFYFMVTAKVETEKQRDAAFHYKDSMLLARECCQQCIDYAVKH
jgi:hypothetical protein